MSHHARQTDLHLVLQGEHAYQRERRYPEGTHHEHRSDFTTKAHDLQRIHTRSPVHNRKHPRLTDANVLFPWRSCPPGPPLLSR